MPAGRIEPWRPLNTLGLDSLMGVELQNQIEEEVGLFVPIVTFLQGASVAELEHFK